MAANPTGHVIHRALERYGLRFTEQDVRDLNNLVKAGHRVHICIHKANMAVFAVRYKRRWLMVGYRKTRGERQVVTLLPPAECVSKIDDRIAELEADIAHLRGIQEELNGYQTASEEE